MIASIQNDLFNYGYQVNYKKGDFRMISRNLLFYFILIDFFTYWGNVR